MMKSAIANLFSTSSLVPSQPIVFSCASWFLLKQLTPSWLSSLSANATFGSYILSSAACAIRLASSSVRSVACSLPEPGVGVRASRSTSCMIRCGVPSSAATSLESSFCRHAANSGTWAATGAKMSSVVSSRRFGSAMISCIAVSTRSSTQPIL